MPSPHPAIPTPTGADQTLNGVVVISPNDAWAVGGTSDLTGFQPAKPIAMHWNGTAWSLTSLSNLGNGGLASVTASSSTSVWAVGTTLPSGGGYHTFAIHHP